jgi:hypothetical protein
MVSTTWEETAKSMQKHRADIIAAIKSAVPQPPADLPLNVTGIPKSHLSEEVVSITEMEVELRLLVSRTVQLKIFEADVTVSLSQRWSSCYYAGLSSISGPYHHVCDVPHPPW